MWPGPARGLLRYISPMVGASYCMHYFFFCEESLVRDSNLHHKYCKEKRKKNLCQLEPSNWLRFFSSIYLQGVEFSLHLWRLLLRKYNGILVPVRTSFGLGRQWNLAHALVLSSQSRTQSLLELFTVHARRKSRVLGTRLVSPKPQRGSKR